MAIEKILFPTKFRELAYESLETLFALKKSGLREVVLQHVISRDDVGFVPFGGYLKEEENKLRQEAEIRFKDWRESLSSAGIESKVVVSVGDPTHEILKTAEKENIDLLILGRKKRSDVSEAFIGSYGHKVITRYKSPILISKYMVQYDRGGSSLTKINKDPFEMPFFAADWSDRSKRALDLIISMKSVIKKVQIFHNIDEKLLEKSGGIESDSHKHKVNAGLNEYCDHLKAAGMETETHIGAGGMLDEILRISRERKASMIVIGNSSEDRLFSNLIDRSLSYQVAKKSELPTLLVP
jgi:nucleotide-binding universal stress UspA family protein